MGIVKILQHSFHIVNASPWPYQVAFATFQMMIGLTLYMHDFAIGEDLFSINLKLVAIGAFLWWRDIIREATFEGQHTFSVQNGLRFGMILFIVSEVMLFFAFFWAFFHSALNPVFQIGAVWPPIGIMVIAPWGIPALNTSLLLTSGASLTWAHCGIGIGMLSETISGFIVTIINATIFTLFQAFEYVHANFNISDGIYGSTFYMLTGLHGFHVIVGTIFLCVSITRVVIKQFTIDAHIGFESSAWYWHFVDIVWIMLFLALYVWGSAS
jgi:heme/copper-type cytochrome/quinol oxidase subunit 3